MAKNDQSPQDLFVNYTTQFISALKKKFKNDLDIQKTSQEYENLFLNCKSKEIKMKLQAKMLKNWYNVFHPLTDKINKGDPSFIDECKHELVEKLNLKQKFADSNAKVQTTILKYIKGINTQSELHHTTQDLNTALPQSLMAKVLNASKSLKSNGKMDFGSIYKVSQDIANSMSQEESSSIEEFANPEKLKSLLSMVQGLK